jgi:hypothetical protein
MPRDKLPMKGAQAAKRSGELQESCDPEIPEWRNPSRVMPRHPELNT